MFIVKIQCLTDVRRIIGPQMVNRQRSETRYVATRRVPSEQQATFVPKVHQFVLVSNKALFGENVVEESYAQLARGRMEASHVPRANLASGPTEQPRVKNVPL